MALFVKGFLFFTPVLGRFACQSAAAGKGTELPVLHLLTKATDFFLKQPDMAPLSDVTGRRSQTEKRAPDLFHEMTTSVEGEALWL